MFSLCNSARKVLKDEKIYGEGKKEHYELNYIKNCLTSRKKSIKSPIYQLNVLCKQQESDIGAFS
jgi:hypothetical protein